MVAGFAVHETITVVTQNGNCDIELCFGDITKLQLQDKVDVIMISAFRGDYSATPTSVIGALKRNLSLNVRDLARNKAEDLRNLYSCWWSHELPAGLPYKRLLCFETRVHGVSRPQELVGDVYRCLVPILNNQDGTVITPLLNTGDQGYSKVLMLKGMVEAAVNWMKAGLPLRKLKIVLYSRFEEGHPPPMAGFKEVCETFGKLKGKFDMKSVVPKEVKIEYDVYLSFSKEDGNTASSISKNLQVAKPDVRIFGKQQELNKDQVWQEDMYEVMIRCARVITVLSPNYLKSTSCVEQYNIALCCNRKARRDLLAPFYIEPVEKMPTYMGLVQYVDCLTVKLSFACEQLALTLNVEVHAEFVHEQPTLQYDVFISYCHRNSEQASQLRNIITDLDPNLKVFFDTQELKTGTTWQQTLYHAIDGTKVLVALVTKEYLLSPVCREEFNLALAKHCQKDRELILVPMFLDEDVEDVPLEFRQIKLVEATGKSFKPAIKSTAKAIVSYLSTHCAENMNELFSGSIDNMDIDIIQEKLRASQLMVDYPLSTRKPRTDFPPDLDDFFLKNDKLPKPTSGAEGCDIVLSFSPNEKKHVKFFCKLLKLFAPSLSVVEEAASGQEMRNVLDSATKIVTFVSPSYIESHDCTEDFNIALCRHRTQENPVIFPIQVHNLPKKPTYFHAVRYSVSTSDTVWSSLIMRNKVTLSGTIRTLIANRYTVSEPEALALMIAARKLVDCFRKEGTYSPIPRPVLSNIGRLITDTSDLDKVEQVDGKSLNEMLICVASCEEQSEKEGEPSPDKTEIVPEPNEVIEKVAGKEDDRTNVDDEGKKEGEKEGDNKENFAEFNEGEQKVNDKEKPITEEHDDGKQNSAKEESEIVKSGPDEVQTAPKAEPPTVGGSTKHNGSDMGNKKSSICHMI